MTPSKFIESLVKAYRNAKVPLQWHPKLSRGESRSIASEAEDRFAYYLIERLKIIDHIFINQTLTSLLNGREERINPDLVICRGDEIRMLIDLKMDLGYQRKEFSDSMKKIEKLVKKLRGQKFSLWKKVGYVRERLEKTLSINAKYVFVVISDKNIDSKQFESIEMLASKFNNTELFVLLRGIHLNDRSFQGRSQKYVMRMAKCHICQESFDKLETLLIESLA